MATSSFDMISLMDGGCAAQPSGPTREAFLEQFGLRHLEELPRVDELELALRRSGLPAGHTAVEAPATESAAAEAAPETVVTEGAPETVEPDAVEPAPTT